MKASDIIKTQCCGNLLQDPKCELIEKVMLLEAKEIHLTNSLKNAMAEIDRLKNG